MEGIEDDDEVPLRGPTSQPTTSSFSLAHYDFRPRMRNVALAGTLALASAGISLSHHADHDERPTVAVDEAEQVLKNLSARERSLFTMLETIEQKRSDAIGGINASERAHLLDARYMGMIRALAGNNTDPAKCGLVCEVLRANNIDATPETVECIRDLLSWNNSAPEAGDYSNQLAAAIEIEELLAVCEDTTIPMQDRRKILKDFFTRAKEMEAKTPEEKDAKSRAAMANALLGKLFRPSTIERIRKSTETYYEERLGVASTALAEQGYETDIQSLRGAARVVSNMLKSHAPAPSETLQASMTGIPTAQTPLAPKP